MAAYAYTATLLDRVAKVLGGHPANGVVFGRVNITNYNSTLAEITEITSKFRGKNCAVVASGVSTNGYLVAWITASNSFKAFYPTKAVTPAGTIDAPVFTGTAPLGDLDLATPAFSGTGQTAAGQVITTTDNQTMTLNQCAGMWLVSATGATAPVLILSNTAVTGAPAVLTVQGAATTDAGAYKIVKNLTPVGTNSAPTLTGTAVAAQAGTEVANDVDIGTVEFFAVGII